MAFYDHKASMPLPWFYKTWELRHCKILRKLQLSKHWKTTLEMSMLKWKITNFKLSNWVGLNMINKKCLPDMLNVYFVILFTRLENFKMCSKFGKFIGHNVRWIFRPFVNSADYSLSLSITMKRLINR